MVIHYFRAYHTLLAILVVLAYLSGDAGFVHAWLGYGVATILLLRLLTAFAGMPQLGLMRFYPRFEGLKLGNVFTHPAISHTLLAGIALCLIGATVTGVAMDRGDALSLSRVQLVDRLNADQPEVQRNETFEVTENGSERLGEMHQALANLLMVLVAMHVIYLFLFKRSLARFMLFLSMPAPRT